MKVAKEVYRYIEYELEHYEDYKRELELERERILESSPDRLSHLPRILGKKDPTAKKAVKLVESTAVLSLERRICAVDRTLSRLSEAHRAMFNEIYVKGNFNQTYVCGKLNISPGTFARHKKHIIYGVGHELGIIPLDSAV